MPLHGSCNYSKDHQQMACRRLRFYQFYQKYLMLLQTVEQQSESNYKVQTRTVGCHVIELFQEDTQLLNVSQQASSNLAAE